VSSALEAMPSTQHAYDHVAGIYFSVAVGVFAAVVVALGVLLVRGARRRSPGRRDEANRLEAGYAVLLAATVGVLVWITFTAETPIDKVVSRPAVRVGVVAAQWSWTFRYANGTTVTAVSTWSPPVAVVPVGEEVQFDATSRDVIHGFWVPGLHYLRQLVPGYTTRFDLLFQRAGRYLGECAVYCGQLHSQMHFAIEAVAPDRFRRWLETKGRNL
jgi:cytochrome c oxidase subunit 2